MQMTWKGIGRQSCRTAAAAIVLAAIPAWSFAATDFAKVIPSEALVAIWADDVPALAEATKASPYGKMWQDTEMEPLRQYVQSEFAEMGEDMKEAGLPTAKEAFTHMKGGAALYMMAQGDTFSLEDLSRTFILELDDAGMEWAKESVKNIANAFEDPTKESAEFQGTTIYEITGTLKPDATLSQTMPGPARTVYYAFEGPYYVAAEGGSNEPVKQAIVNLKAGASDQNLHQVEAMRIFRGKAAAKPSQVNLFIDTGRMIKQSMEAKTMDASVLAMLPQTGLYDLEALAISATPSSQSILFDTALIVPQTKSGLIKAYHDAGPVNLDMLKYVPGDALSLNTFSLDLGAILDSVMGIFQKANPQAAAMLNMQIISMQSQYGVNLLDGILKRLQGSHLIYERPFDETIKRELAAEHAIQKSTGAILSIANGQETSANIKSLLEKLTKDPNFAGYLETEEAGTATLIRIVTPGAQESPLGFFAAFNQQYLMMANNEVELREILRAVEQGHATSPMAQTPEMQSRVQTARAKAGNELYVFSYAPAEAVEYTIEQFETLANMGLLQGMDGFSPDMLPSAGMAGKYIGPTTSTATFGDRILMLHMETDKAE